MLGSFKFFWILVWGATIRQDEGIHITPSKFDSFGTPPLSDKHGLLENHSLVTCPMDFLDLCNYRVYLSRRRIAYCHSKICGGFPYPESYTSYMYVYAYNVLGQCPLEARLYGRMRLCIEYPQVCLSSRPEGRIHIQWLRNLRGQSCNTLPGPKMAPWGTLSYSWTSFDWYPNVKNDNVRWWFEELSFQ